MLSKGDCVHQRAPRRLRPRIRERVPHARGSPRPASPTLITAIPLLICEAATPATIINQTQIARANPSICDRGVRDSWIGRASWPTSRGTVDQEPLARNEHLAAENRILKAQLKG